LRRAVDQRRADIAIGEMSAGFAEDFAARPHDHRFISQVFAANEVLARQAVRDRQGQFVAFLEQGQRGIILDPTQGKRIVQPAFIQSVEQFLFAAVIEIEPDAGMRCRKAGDQSRYQGGRQGLQHAQTQHIGLFCPGDFGGGHIDFMQDRLDARQEARARRGQEDALVIAHEQQHAQLVFQPSDTRRKRRLGDQTGRGRLGEAAGLDHRQKVAQQVQFHILSDGGNS